MEELLPSLAGADAGALVVAIRQAARRLAAPDLAEPQRGTLARAVLAHARHVRSNVREAVAEAALHFPDDAFNEAIGIVLDDAHQFVKRAAERTYDERSRRARVVREQQEQSAGMRHLRARIAGEGGDAGLRDADRLCELALSQFVERLDHEIHKLTTPLASAMSDVFTEARRDVPDRARLAARADDVHAMVNLLLGIVASARAHAAVTAPSFAEVAVGSLVDEQLALLRARVGDAKRARLRIDVNVDPSITIEADRILLGQALSNVLQNAVEAYPETAEGEELEIGLRVASECPKGDVLVTIAVEDRGRGIDAKWIANVGEPFISTKGRGRGLGMLNVKKMVESVHGGVVDIDSEVGRGTRVELRVPRKQSRGKRPVRKSRAKVAE